MQQTLDGNSERNARRKTAIPRIVVAEPRFEVMEEAYQNINTLAATLVEMQTRVQAAEVEATTARAERQALADRIVASEGRARSTGLPAGGPAAAAAAHASPPQLVDTRSIGKIPTFNGDRESWNDWSFQFASFLAAAHLKAGQALKWAASVEVPIELDDAALEDDEYPRIAVQTYLALVLLCKGPALSTHATEHSRPKRT